MRLSVHFPVFRNHVHRRRHPCPDYFILGACAVRAVLSTNRQAMVLALPGRGPGAPVLGPPFCGTLNPRSDSRAADTPRRCSRFSTRKRSNYSKSKGLKDWLAIPLRASPNTGNTDARRTIRYRATSTYYDSHFVTQKMSSNLFERARFSRGVRSFNSSLPSTRAPCALVRPG